MADEADEVDTVAGGCCIFLQIKHIVSNTFLAVQPRVIFTSRRLQMSVNKDVLPTSQTSNVIYEFQCRCEARDVGRKTLRLADWIKQHVPLAI